MARRDVAVVQQFNATLRAVAAQGVAVIASLHQVQLAVTMP